MGLAWFTIPKVWFVRGFSPESHFPAGLDRGEMVRLAKLRSTIDKFDDSKLSEGGFKILVGEQDVVSALDCVLGVQII